MRRTAWVAAVALSALLAPAARGEDHLDEELQGWLQASATFVVPVGPIKLVPYLELQPRFGDDGQDFDEVLHRAALLVRPLKGLSAGLGFTYVSYWDPSYEPEYRPYQEVSYQRDLLGGALRVATRLRFEQRYFVGQDPALSLRLRARVGLLAPFARLGDVGIGLSTWEEVFFNLNDTNQHPEGLDQNRAFIGLWFGLAQGIEVEAGYMAQLGRRKHAPDSLGHTIWLGVALTFD